MKAIIMAGGEGTRLRPLTCDRPKPMVPAMNRPVMEHILHLLKRHHLNHIAVTLQYLPQEIQDYFREGTDFGVELQYYIEEVPLGTAGSGKNAQDFLDDTFLVISGDALTDIDLSAAIQFHRAKKAVATLILTAVDTPLEYGVVITDTQGRITRFLEKPGWGEVFSDKVNTGIYILEPRVLNLFAPGQVFDFSKDLFPRLLAEGLPIYGHIASGYWCDIGNLQQYRQAHFDFLSGRVDLEIPEPCSGAGIWLGAHTQIDPKARIKGPVLIGADCYIGPEVQIEGFTIIGDNVVIEKQASLKRSIVWNNCYIGKRAQLRGAVLANRVQIQANAAVFEGAVVGDDSIIGQHGIVKPSTKIWPYKRVEKGSIVNTSLIWGTRNNRILFGNQGVTGEANTEITPDFIARLGAAYGTWLNPQATVAVGADDREISRALKGAFIAGLVSTGVQVWDLGQVVTPITRYNTRHLGLQGGVQIQGTHHHPENVTLTFFDARGAEISRSAEKKIESLLSREDFRRVEVNRVGQWRFYPEASQAYFAEIVNTIDLERLRSRQFKLVLGAPNRYVKRVIRSFLHGLGCNISLVEYSEPEKNLSVPILGDTIRDMVKRQQADLGVIFDTRLEKFTLISDAGQLISEELFTALVSVLVLSRQKKGTVVVPVNAPGVIEQLAEKYEGKVVRTQAAIPAFMDKLLSPEIENNQLDKSDAGSTSQFLLHSDGLVALIQILNYLVDYEVRLSDLLDKIPQFYFSKQIIRCPWEAKGRVMRTLIEEQSSSDASEMLEGVKIQHPQGWVLVVPDAEEPVCRVYGEGFSQEIAESLTDWYVKRIQEIEQGP